MKTANRIQKKRAYHHGDLRSTLIKAALRIIETRGISDLSLREVAKLAGVTHAAPYSHFDSKDALIAAVKQLGFIHLRDFIKQALEKSPASPKKRLLTLARSYALFALEHTSEFQVMFMHPLKNPPKDIDYVSAGREIFSTLEEIFAEWARDRESPIKDVKLASLGAWSLIHGATSLWVEGPVVHVAAEKADRETFLRTIDELARFVVDRI